MDSDILPAIAGGRDDSPMAVAKRLLDGDDGGFFIDTVADRRFDTSVSSGAMRLRALLDGFGPDSDKLLPYRAERSESDAVTTETVSRAGALYEQF